MEQLKAWLKDSDLLLGLFLDFLWVMVIFGLIYFSLKGESAATANLVIVAIFMGFIDKR